jgi:hypothetical protein
LAMEGIRAARLSGFSVCVRAFAGDEKTRETAEMIELGRSLDVDGIVATGAARKQIGNFWWESLSRMIEAEILGAEGKAGAGVQAGAAADVEAESNEDEEGVRVA